MLSLCLFFVYFSPLLALLDDDESDSASGTGSAPPDVLTITIGENGALKVLDGNPSGFNGYIYGSISSDHGPSGSLTALAFNVAALLANTTGSLISGDILIKNGGGTVLDVIRFNGSSNQVFYYSGNEGAPADRGLPTSFQAKSLSVVYNPTGTHYVALNSSYPGFINRTSSFLSVTYIFEEYLAATGTEVATVCKQNYEIVPCAGICCTFDGDVTTSNVTSTLSACLVGDKDRDTKFCRSLPGGRPTDASLSKTANTCGIGVLCNQL